MHLAAAFGMMGLITYIPSKSALGQMVDCGESSSQVIRLFVGSRHCHTETNTLRCCSHGAYNGQRLVYRPLRARYLRRIQVAVINVVTTKHVGNEDTMDLGFLKQLG
jgi:hypothetical protein